MASTEAASGGGATLKSTAGRSGALAMASTGADSAALTGTAASSRLNTGRSGGGAMASKVESVFLVPTDYSPMK